MTEPKKSMKIIFKNKLEPEIYEAFMTEKFSIRLSHIIHPERQRDIVRTLVKEGLIDGK